jgi:hypothetical protein
LLGHLPVVAQLYLQVPLLGADGEVDGMRWYHLWDPPEQKMIVWLWLRVGAAVTFAHGERVMRGAAFHWDLRCWRATCA